MHLSATQLTKCVIHSWTAPVIRNYQTHPYCCIVVGIAQRYRCGRRARAATKVRMITGRLQNPIVPANVRKRNVQTVSTARRRRRRAIDVALRPSHRAAAVRVHHDERPEVVVEPQQSDGRMRFACGASHLDDVLRAVAIVVSEPALHFAFDLDFHPAFCASEKRNGVG